VLPRRVLILQDLRKLKGATGMSSQVV
jgi:hypothetical protein